MELSDQRARECTRRLLLSRTRLLTLNGFYGLLLMHMKFGLDETVSTACTDGEYILFNPDFMESLLDRELDFVLMHEVLHVALQHCFRAGDRDPERFNIACDIVVNSNILRSMDMDPRSITLISWGESMHRTPDGREGFEFTAEEVYEMLGRLPSGKPRKGSGSTASGKGGKSGKMPPHPGPGSGRWDSHEKWGSADPRQKELWTKRLKDACEAISVRDPSNTRGLVPLCAQRLLKALTGSRIDWRTILNEFIQEDFCDYTFSPPDRRHEGDFFLPDWGDPQERVEKVLFMADTSGSVSDDLLTAAFSEVKGALDQFQGRLSGWLGFFDAEVIPPIPFSDEQELLSIKPKGGGGTDFSAVFQYVKDHMVQELPSCIILLTDGYAPFPEESAAMGIPVLWLLPENKVTPPWGKVARIPEEKPR